MELELDYDALGIADLINVDLEVWIVFSETSSTAERIS